MAKKDWMVKTTELDDQQREVFFSVLDKSCIVTGCAGSGKSVLALLKAQRIQKEKGQDSCQVIVYTKSLSGFMRKGKESLNLSSKFYYYEEWKWKKTMRRYGRLGMLPVYERDGNGDKIPNMPSTDYVIVDEIQDFEQSEIQEFISATGKNFFFFGDEAQSIFQKYRNTISPSAINKIFFPAGGGAKLWELYYNHRLPIPVAQVAQYVGVNLPPFNPKIYKSEETELPRFICYQSKDEQIEAVSRIIKNQDLEDVAILLPTGDDVKSVYDALCNLGIDCEVKYDDRGNIRNSLDTLDFDTPNAKIMTYHSAKGLQFETIFLPYIELYYDDRADDSRALYVAMTRTSRNLFLMYCGQLPSPINGIDSSMYKTTEIG